MYKDWRLRNSTDLWRPNSSKHISANGTSQTAKTREKQQGWDGDCSEQAGAKMQQKYSPVRGLQRNENAAFSSDVFERSGHSKISPYSRSNGRCRSTSSSWNSRLSSGVSDVTCRTSGARIAAHLRAEEESCQELAAEGQVMHRSVEQEDQTRPRSVESFRRTEETILHPITVRDIAIHPTLEDAQIKGDGNSYTPEDWDSTNSYSEPRHVQYQVTGQQSRNNSSSASTEAWKDLRDVEATRAESDSVFLDDVQSQTRDMKLKLRPEEDCKGFKTVAAEQKFGRPLNKFITGGALHALASLTRLDSSLDSSMDFEVERPGAATEDFQEAFQQNNHIREHLGESQVKDSMSCNAGPTLPEKPKHPRALRALAHLPRLGFSEAERPDAATGDLQQPFEQRNHIREHFGESQVENLRSCNVGPILPEKPTQKKPFPATDSQGSSLANKSEGQSVIMRANIAFEPAAPPVATVYMGKKIKMKAPTPKLSSRAKKPKPTACDAKDASVLQIGEREIEDDGQKQNCPNDDCTILDAADLESLRRSTTIANDEAREDEKTVTEDARKPNTCVVTHNEHSIEVQELQDPPCRRRWPKVLPVCTSVSNRAGAERSSTSSICESLQEERILKGGNAESAAVQHGDLLEGEATNPSSKDALERLASIGAVSVDDGEERNTEQYKEGSEQQDCSSKDAAVGKTGLRICVPSASVREISINSASRIQPWTLSDAHRRQGEEGKLKRLGNEFQSNRESPASSALSYLSSRDPNSVMPEEELRGSPTLQESKSFLPVSNLPGPASGSPETFDQGAIPERERDDPSNENSASTVIVSSNSSIAGRYRPALALATLSRGQPSQITPERIEFGRSVFNSAPPHEETYAERASLSSEKLCSILSYLGHVEESNLQENYNILQKTKSTCYSPNGNRSPRTVLEHDDSVSSADSTFTTTLTNVSNRSPTSSNANSGDGERNRNKAVSLFEGVRKKIQHYKDRIAGQESQNAELLKDMERVMADKEQTLSRERDKFGRELEKRAAEYEAAIQHHLALNEKMIKDKETLSEKWCKIAGILSTAESKFEEKQKAMQEQHTQDLKKQKELWIAGEKPRREAWKEMKLKEIKEITIKGLEPHIEGIVEKNKQEMQKQEMRCADDKQKKLELQAIQHRKEMSELRDRLLKERDDLLEKERMAALQKMNEVAEKYEQQAMQLRMRVSGDMAAELERAEESRRKDKHDAHELLSKFQKEAAEREDTLRKGLESAMQDAISKREGEISKMKNEWQKVLDEKLQEEMQIKEQEIQARCTKERDEQIEMIIERMDMDKDDAVNQQQQDLLVKVEGLMEEKLDFMKRMKEVESKCATLCQLSLEAKKKAELELEIRDLQVASLERELSCQSDLIEKLKAQINQEQSNLTQQEERFEKRIKKEQELLESALRDVEKCNAEAQQMRSRKVEELAEVESHVRQAIDNKDLVITGLREQLLSAREQIRHTEQLLLL